MSVTKPDSTESLDAALRHLSSSEADYVANRALVANSIVGSLMLEEVVKGGFAMMLRYGKDVARASFDLDANRKMAPDASSQALGEALSHGWEGFTFDLTERPRRAMDGEPADFVNQAFDIRLTYLGSTWYTIEAEASYNEFAATEEPDMFVPVDANRLLTAMGFPELGPIAILNVDSLVAQKLHGVSEPGGGRAKDLIDLQIIASHTSLDLPRVKKSCEHLFAHRRSLESCRESARSGRRSSRRARAGTRHMPSGWCRMSSPPPTRRFAWANDLVRTIDASE